MVWVDQVWQKLKPEWLRILNHSGQSLSGVSCRIHYAIRSELRLEAAISEDSARRDADMSYCLREKSRPITFRRTSEPEEACCQPNCQGDVISRRKSMPYAKACSRHEQPIAMQSYDKYFRKTTRFVIIFLGLAEG